VAVSSIGGGNRRTRRKLLHCQRELDLSLSNNIKLNIFN